MSYPYRLPVLSSNPALVKPVMNIFGAFAFLQQDVSGIAYAVSGGNYQSILFG